MSKLERKLIYYDNDQLKYEGFYLNNKIHNETGPAYKRWYKNGQLRSEEFFLNGKRHNETGPAYKSWYDNGQLCHEGFYLNGKQYIKPEWEKKIIKKPKKLYKPWG